MTVVHNFLQGGRGQATHGGSERKTLRSRLSEIDIKGTKTELTEKKGGTVSVGRRRTFYEEKEKKKRLGLI